MNTAATLSELSESQKNTARNFYEKEGYYLAPKVISDELIQQTSARMDAVLAGDYQTGVQPSYRNFAPGEGASKLQKVDNAHLCDPVIYEAITSPELGQWAAAITGARRIQVFTTQMLVKPPGTEQTVNVGWHQDLEYWAGHLRGQLFTAWLAISDVTATSGPMKFVRGSNDWGLLKAGDFFSGNLDEIKARLQAKRGSDSWNEAAGILAPGCVSFHHCLTIHGSGSNTAALPRRSFAIHLRTENADFVDGITYKDAPWLNDWNDEHACPVIYRED